MTKTIFLHNLSKIFFGDGACVVTEKKFLMKLCKKDGFCHFWGKIRF